MSVIPELCQGCQYEHECDWQPNTRGCRMSEDAETLLTGTRAQARDMVARWRRNAGEYVDDYGVDKETYDE